MPFAFNGVAATLEKRFRLGEDVPGVVIPVLADIGQRGPYQYLRLEFGVPLAETAEGLGQNVARFAVTAFAPVTYAEFILNLGRLRLLALGFK